MKIYQIQATEDEIAAMLSVVDAFKGNLHRGSAFYRNCLVVEGMLSSKSDVIFDTDVFLNRCQTLVENKDLSEKGFDAVQALIKTTENRLEKSKV